MELKKEINILSLFLLVGFVVFFSYILKSDNVCEPLLNCLRVAIFGAPYQYFFLPILSVFFSVVPLYFLKEQIYKIWRKFALFALPCVALLIFFAPAHTVGDYVSIGYDREVASMIFSVLFVLVSYIIITYNFFSLRSK